MKIGTHETHAPCVSHSLSQLVFLIISPGSVQHVIDVYIYTTKNHRE